LQHIPYQGIKNDCLAWLLYLSELLKAPLHLGQAFLHDQFYLKKNPAYFFYNPKRRDALFFIDKNYAIKIFKHFRFI